MNEVHRIITRIRTLTGTPRHTAGAGASPVTQQLQQRGSGADRIYACMTAAGAFARSAWGRASALRGARRLGARIVAAVPRTEVMKIVIYVDATCSITVRQYTTFFQIPSTLPFTL